MTKQPILNVPTRKEIEAIEVGTMALDCFGKLAKVVAVSAKREDIHGKLFCCYNTDFGPGSSISMSQKEDKLTRTVAASNRYKSAELDVIEAEILSTRNQ